MSFCLCPQQVGAKWYMEVDYTCNVTASLCSRSVTKQQTTNFVWGATVVMGQTHWSTQTTCRLAQRTRTTMWAARTVPSSTRPAGGTSTATTAISMAAIPSVSCGSTNTLTSGCRCVPQRWWSSASMPPCCQKSAVTTTWHQPHPWVMTSNVTTD